MFMQGVLTQLMEQRITAQETSKILGGKNIRTIQRYHFDGKLQNQSSQRTLLFKMGDVLKLGEELSDSE